VKFVYRGIGVIALKPGGMKSFARMKDLTHKLPFPDYGHLPVNLDQHSISLGQCVG